MTTKLHIPTLLVTLALLLLPALCPARQVVDQAGRTVTLPDDPRRVVALAPNITEMVFLLGEGGRLKGVTKYSNEPAAARALPRVGSYVRLDIEKILALKPDLCLAVKDGNPLATVERLEGLGIPVYVIDPKNLADIMDVVTGSAISWGPGRRPRRSSPTCGTVSPGWRPGGRPPPAAPGSSSRSMPPPSSRPGRGTFLDELITLAGGENLAARTGLPVIPYSTGSRSCGWRREVVIVASMAGGHSAAELEAGWRRWPQVPAVSNGRLYVVTADLFDRPTPHLVDGLEAFAADHSSGAFR